MSYQTCVASPSFLTNVSKNFTIALVLPDSITDGIVGDGNVRPRIKWSQAFRDCHSEKDFFFFFLRFLRFPPPESSAPSVAVGDATVRGHFDHSSPLISTGLRSMALSNDLC